MGDSADIVHALMEQQVAAGSPQVPVLPEIAVRVMRLSADPHANAERLAELVRVDVGLSAALLRVANGVTRRPLEPIRSLHQAIAWLGLDETANLAFTIVVQGRLLNIPGQNQAVRRLWRHALASALWARQLAQRVAFDPGICYLCGLLHEVGRPVALALAHEAATRARLTLTPPQYAQLVGAFCRPLGALAAEAWQLPVAVAGAIAHWDAYAGAGDLRIECNIVALAHRLADRTIEGATVPGLELLALEPVYADLGLSAPDAAGLAASAGEVSTELALYFPA
jgi:HD-like signal output (HDOD) protein